MSSSLKKSNMISQIVRLRQVVTRWKNSSSFTRRRGSLAVYVGAERRRFVIPTRFLNLPVFVDLLDKAAEEYGFQANANLVLPVDLGFFVEILRYLEIDEVKYGRFCVDEFWNLVNEADFDRSKCKESANSHAFTPLLTKTRV